MNPLTEQLAKLLENAPQEFRKNSRAFASAVLAQLNVVSREEFDAHCELLSRATERLQELEKTVAKLESEKQGKPAVDNAASKKPAKKAASKSHKDS